MILFLRDRNKYRVTMTSQVALALNGIAALMGLLFLEMLDATYTLGACLLLCEVSQKISRYLGISTKRA